MNWPHTVPLVLVTYLAVFCQSRWPVTRPWLGTQVDLLPVLAVYAGFSGGLPTIALVTVLGGFWLDSLSANPFGISVLPLVATGLAVHRCRTMILRDDLWTQFLVGLAACAGVPLFTLMLVAVAGEAPLSGGWYLWRWLAAAVVGGAFTPLVFSAFARIETLFSYQPEPSVSFRPDRQIARGRDPHAHH